MTQQIELLKERLEQLIDCEALELLRCAEQDPDDIYIPYMMNDAVELYAVLTHCTAVGELSAYFPVGTQVTGAEADGQYHVTLYRPDGTCLTRNLLPVVGKNTIIRIMKSAIFGAKETNSGDNWSIKLERCMINTNIWATAAVMRRKKPCCRS